MPSMKCINKEICLLAIAISSAFTTLKTTLLTTQARTVATNPKVQNLMRKTCRFSTAQCFVKPIIIIQVCICSKCKQTGARAITMTSKEIYTVDDAICKNWR